MIADDVSSRQAAARRRMALDADVRSRVKCARRVFGSHAETLFTNAEQVRDEKGTLVWQLNTPDGPVQTLQEIVRWMERMWPSIGAYLADPNRTYRTSWQSISTKFSTLLTDDPTGPCYPKVHKHSGKRIAPRRRAPRRNPVLTQRAFAGWFENLFGKAATPETYANWARELAWEVAAPRKRELESRITDWLSKGFAAFPKQRRSEWARELFGCIAKRARLEIE